MSRGDTDQAQWHTAPGAIRENGTQPLDLVYEKDDEYRVYFGPDDLLLSSSALSADEDEAAEAFDALVALVRGHAAATELAEARGEQVYERDQRLAVLEEFVRAYDAMRMLVDELSEDAYQHNQTNARLRAARAALGDPT